jgi:hypothetical protein
MKRSAALIVLLLATAAFADEPHAHDHGPVDLGKLGKVSFDVSCDRSVRADFARAVAMMHSFWYAPAEKAFTEIAAKDPQCAMAWWGVAMANYHPIWTPPTKDELQRGLAAVQKAKSMKGGTPREQQYIDAINTFYSEAGTLDHATRAKAYEHAMEKVASNNPKDDEAAIFYALSLLGTAPNADKTYANQKKAAAILNTILPKQPEHPGVAHYVIHSFDYPSLASLALPAARAYAKIAPGSPHALHMPSHIFTRLGLWDESITSNLASAEKARKYAAQASGAQASFDELHAIDYLVYAYMQRGDDVKAKALLDKLMKVPGDAPGLNQFAAAYALAATPVRYALERRQWKDAAAIVPHPNYPWGNFPYAEANAHYGRAIGAARAGDLNTAKAAIDRLVEIKAKLTEQKNSYWVEQAEIQIMAARSWLAQSAGLHDEALRLARAAADREDLTEKHPVTPGPVIPARELLAEMLMEQSKHAEALLEVERSLKVSPGRYRAEALAAQAAEGAGLKEKATEHYRALTVLAASNATRPELERARREAP